MKYLTTDQLIDTIKRGKTVEALVDKNEENGYPTIQWLAIEKGRERKGIYYIILHHVFDDRSDGVESVYNFSYVNPDDLYGKIIAEFESHLDAINFVKENFLLSLDKFVTEGFIEELI
ncbi:MAG: hypothetical protein MJA30_13115 [Cytophagales bacterium]|nr:hypothetical protein [Cytophagales bacterium]